jgi:agmatinase
MFDGIYGLPFTPDEARVVLVPVPWEATCSYRAGTALGPAAIAAGSRQVELFDHDTGRPYQSGIAMLPLSDQVRAWNDAARSRAQPVIAAGGPGEDAALAAAVREVDQLGRKLNAWVAEQVASAVDRGKLVGIVGGDHSTPLGGIEALAERQPGLGILHIDAHADLRQAYEGFRYSHASIMWNVLELEGVSRLVQVGVRDYCEEERDRIVASTGRVNTHFDPDLRRRLQEGETWRGLCAGIVHDLPRLVYVSFDIDGLDPSLCPNTGTPVVGGLAFPEVVALLREVVDSGRRIIGFDLTEVAPDPSSRGDWDGNVGARLLYKLIGFSLLSA